MEAYFALPTKLSNLKIYMKKGSLRKRLPFFVSRHFHYLEVT
jgi:hypothetical protein